MPPEAPVGVMSENLTPQEAANVLRAASAYEDALVQRTEGLTLMVWGMLLPGLFLSYAFADSVDAPSWAFSLVWVPWVLAGSVATMATWRSAAIERPAIAEMSGGSIVLRIVAFAAAIFLAMLVVQPQTAAGGLAVLAIAYAAMAAVNPFGSSRTNRLATAVGSAVAFTTAATLLLVGLPGPLETTLALAGGGVPYFTAGLWQTLRG